MPDQTGRENFALQTFLRLNPAYLVHINTSADPVRIVVANPDGSETSYPLDTITDRYALLPQADADSITNGELEKDGVLIGTPVGGRRGSEKETGKETDYSPSGKHKGNK